MGLMLSRGPGPMIVAACMLAMIDAEATKAKHPALTL